MASTRVRAAGSLCWILSYSAYWGWEGGRETPTDTATPGVPSRLSREGAQNIQTVKQYKLPSYVTDANGAFRGPRQTWAQGQTTGVQPTGHHCRLAFRTGPGDNDALVWCGAYPRSGPLRASGQSRRLSTPHGKEPPQDKASWGRSDGRG